MKRYLGIFLAIAFALVVVVWASKKYSAKALEAERESSAARIKIDYLERVGWIRSNPDEKAYKDEVTTFLRKYFSQVNDHLNRFGGNREFDDYLKEVDRRTGAGANDSQVADKKAYFAYTKSVFDLLRSGNYAPLWSDTDQGMRLDVVSASTKAGPEPQIRYRLILWGAQRELRDEGRNLKKMVTSAGFNVTWRLLDETGKLIAEVTASGDPANKVEFPERMIAEFPPQMVLGHYDIDLLPAETKTVEIIFNVSSRAASGGDARATYTWKLDAPSEWKLRPGEVWKNAQESVRPLEEIQPKAEGNKE